ncbi:FAD-dependent oxidoreductase [Pseudonocardia xinjiangensis]|uniref:FAD-dependent oxidoreductase n=1 Tax=Pseudonocardia xinjiangensis TaxID=75289 RepID=UPI003D8AF7EA
MTRTAAGRGHAVVLGAGIAGLLSARVLSGAFDGVTVVERDGDTTDGLVRRGVPQGAHLHGLLDGGRRIIEELHPGLTDELVAAGAADGEPLRDTRWYLHGRRLHATSTGLRSVLSTRPLLEQVLRARTAALPGVTFAPPATAVGLVRGPDGTVGGVRVRRATGEQTIDARLVVDASGRSSRLPAWLTALGEPAPVEDRVDVDLAYATRFYRRRTDQLGGRLSVIVSTIPRSRGGGALAVEGDRWQVTLAGILGDAPPADAAGYTAWAATLPVPDIAELIADAEPVTDPVPFRFRGSRWRRYDRLPAPTAGVVAIGDAVCSVNPLYAQGMSLAAQQALVLRERLAAPGPLDAGSYYRALAPICRRVWDIATRSDLALPEVDGTRPLLARVLDTYVRRVQLAAHRSPAVARAFLRVANLVDPPAALLAPAVLAAVLRPGATAPLPAARDHAGTRAR